MASIHYSVLRVVSMLGGLVLVGVAAFLNVHHAAESEGSYLSPVCIAIVALAFGSALAVPVMLTLWRTGRGGLALLALLGVAVSEIYGFQLSAERLLAARDQRAQQVKTAGNPYAQATKAMARTVTRILVLQGLFRDQRRIDQAGFRSQTHPDITDEPRVDDSCPHRKPNACPNCELVLLW